MFAPEKKVIIVFFKVVLEGLLCVWLLIGQLKDWTGNGGERGFDMQLRPEGGIKPRVAAVRTQPLYMTYPLYQLRHQAP